MESYQSRFRLFSSRSWKDIRKRQLHYPDSWIFKFHFYGVNFIFWFFVLIVIIFLSRVVWASSLSLLRLEKQQLNWLVPPRGLIFDRQGRLLVENRPMYFFHNNWVSYEELFLGSFLKDNKALSTVDSDLPIRYQRYYPFDKETASVLGYVGLASKQEIERYNCSLTNNGYCLAPNSFVGRQGLEQSYEALLQGRVGIKIGQKLWRPPYPGKDLRLTLDLDLQKYLYHLLEIEGKVGAGVVLNSKGEVLALVSYPSFAANVLSGSQPISEAKRQREVNQLFQDKDKPLVNKAYQEAYPPGSVFKLVTALAALDRGKITPSTQIEDTGFIKVGDYIYRNWYWTEYGRKEGMLNVIRAIARSNDIFFYKVGALVGPEAIAEYATKLGLGESSGIDLPREEFGLVPTPHWKKAVRGEKWFLGNTYHLAIGQGDLRVTPLQIARLTLIIANRGLKTKVHLNQSWDYSPISLGIGKDKWQPVIQGMREACAPGGTAFVFFHYPLQVAGKTGTAQAGKDQEPHAWFTLFAPVKNPRYVVTIFLKNAGEGSYQAAPLAKKIVNYLFKIPDNEKSKMVK